MKKVFLFCIIFMVIGCSYIKEPETFIRDPHFQSYQSKVDELERSYLHKWITFDQFKERKRQLDEDYLREVQKRESIIKGY